MAIHTCIHTQHLSPVHETTSSNCPASPPSHVFVHQHAWQYISLPASCVGTRPSFERIQKERGRLRACPAPRRLHASLAEARLGPPFLHLSICMYVCVLLYVRVRWTTSGMEGACFGPFFPRLWVCACVATHAKSSLNVRTILSHTDASYILHA